MPFPRPIGCETKFKQPKPEPELEPKGYNCASLNLEQHPIF